MALQWLTVLGSTGSIGCSTLAVVTQHPDLYQVFALTAHSQYQRLFEQIQTVKPRFAVMACPIAAEKLRALLANQSLLTEVLIGDQALFDVCRAHEVTTVVAAIVGAAGLRPTWAAVLSGKRILLANKESLVMAGQLFMNAVREHQAKVLPVDSEHNAIFQCLPQSFQGLPSAGIRCLWLTGSGGPFRTREISTLDRVTPEEACNHPNWQMGPKISVDSATMMNKGLEYIEACWLFNAEPQDIRVLLHPQSIVHSMVEYIDGSVLAQMGQPDMRTPIAHCLAWPNRISSGVQPLNFFELNSLSFAPIDTQRYPCLNLAIKAMQAGGSLTTALNAANEVAVDTFLRKALKFTQIAELVDSVLNQWTWGESQSLDDVLAADADARRLASIYIQNKC